MVRGLFAASGAAWLQTDRTLIKGFAASISARQKEGTSLCCAPVRLVDVVVAPGKKQTNARGINTLLGFGKSDVSLVSRA
jgi:hypothetical protein